MSTQVKIVKFIPLNLTADKGDGKYASLTWSIRKGYPRVTVYTDNNNDRNGEFVYDRLIIAPFDAITINMVMDTLDKVIKDDKPSEQAIKCYNVEFVNHVKTDNIIKQATVTLGKDTKGVIYIKVENDNNPPTRFDLMPNPKWHKFVDETGGEITDNRILSNMHAKAYATRLRSLMDKYLADDDNVKITSKDAPVIS